MDKIELKILTISAGHTAQSYTLVMEEKNGPRKLPIVIGSAEAQSIAVQIENIKPVRPLTHDLLKSVISGFSIELKEVYISKLEEGIFYSELHLEQDGKVKIIDARTSDAVALALRFDSPIFTSKKIMSEAGISLDQDQVDTPEFAEESSVEPAIFQEEESKSDLYDFSKSELEEMLSEALEEENYDLAAKIRDEINRR